MPKEYIVITNPSNTLYTYVYEIFNFSKIFCGKFMPSLFPNAIKTFLIESKALA